MKIKKNLKMPDWLSSLPWRTIFARLPLPMLALAASYGVYSYALLFVPEWVAIIQASAFEMTYIGLAITKGLDLERRKKATHISVGAVAVSIVYNSLAGLFHRQPDLLKGLDWRLEVILAILHGLPLALVAYLVADLLLHTDKAEDIKPTEKPQAKTVTTEAADSSATLEDVQAVLLEEAPLQAKIKIADMTPEQRSAFYKQRAALGRQAMLANKAAREAE